MKHEMNILYVIAVIAWIIYSFVSKNNKEKNKGKQVDEKTTRPAEQPDIKRMLEELLGKTEVEKTTPPPVYETRKPTIEPVYESSEGQSQEGGALNPVDNYEFGKYQTLEEVITDEATVASQYEKFSSLNYSEQTAPHSIAEKEGRTEVVNTVEEKENHPAKDFDIEKAIIYSEILKRPAWAA